MAGHWRIHYLFLIVAGFAPVAVVNPQESERPEDAKNAKAAKTATPTSPVDTNARDVEPAVRAALDWLLRHQSPDGSWRASDFIEQCEDSQCWNENDERYGEGLGLAEHDIGVTGLAMLALSHRARRHDDALAEACRERLHRAARFLFGVQVTSENPVEHGRFGSDAAEQWIYSHAIATLALGEYFPLAENRLATRASLRAAVELCLFAQNDGFGWRYDIKPSDNDTSVTGWMVLALKSAERTPLGIARNKFERAFEGARRWLDRATAVSGKTGYMVPGGDGARLAVRSLDPYPYSKAVFSMTAVGVLSRLLLGEKRSSDLVRKGIQGLLREPPKWNEQKGRYLSRINFYYWYHGTRVLWRFGGANWQAWSRSLRDALLPAQRKAGDEAGSWDPIGEWGSAGGRVYSTALGALALQVLLDDDATRSPEPRQTGANDGDLAKLDLLREPVDGWRHLVAAGARWKYAPEKEPPPRGLEWTSPSFDDAAWPEGESGFGHDERGQFRYRTALQGPAGKGSLFLRKVLTVPDPAAVEKVVLVVRASGDFMAFLNGLEVLNSHASQRAGDRVLFFGDRRPLGSMRESPDSWASLLDSPVDVYVHPLLIQPGKNVLAIYASKRSRDEPALFVLPTLLVKRRAPTREKALGDEAADSDRARREAYLAARHHELRGEQKEALEKLGEVARLGSQWADPLRRLVRTARAAGELAVAEAGLRESLRGAARSLDEIWDLWYTASAVELGRSAREIYDTFPSVDAPIPSVRGADLAWLFRGLVQDGTVRIDCGGNEDRFFAPRSRAGKLVTKVDGGRSPESDESATVRRPAEIRSTPLYSIPLPPGAYRVVLETPGELVGSVTVEGRRVLEGFASRRSATPQRKTVEGPVRDGALDIVLDDKNALLSALEISLLERDPPEAFSARPPFGPPERPKSRKSQAEDVVELEATSFRHPVPAVTHATSRWQVRASFGSYETSAVLDVESEENLTSLTLPIKGLLPDTRYYWRVAYTGSNGTASAYSDESFFRTDDAGWDIFRFDLTAYFNRDVVANAGDEDDFEEGYVDSGTSELVELGFDGKNSFRPEVQGLPFDRVVGLHLLGDYSRPNALQLGFRGARGESATPVRLKIPDGEYSQVRFLVTGGNGDSEMPVTLEYEDGTTAERTIPCDDWFHDDDPEDPIGTLKPGVRPLIDDLDRLTGNKFDDANDAALFEVILEVDPARVLEAIVLHPEKARDTDAAAQFNLFAVTGVRVPESSAQR